MAKITCSVCGIQTSKGKSYAIGDGKRACRSHDGVLDKMRSLEKEADDRRADGLAKAEAKRCRKSEPFVLRPSCWVCGVYGILERDFWASLLVLNAKEEIKGNLLNPFGDEYKELARKASGLAEGESVIITVPYDLNKHVMSRIKRECAPVAHLAKCIALCTDCSSSLKAVKNEAMRLSLEDAIVLHGLMKPELNKLAQAEIDRESSTN